MQVKGQATLQSLLQEQVFRKKESSSEGEEDSGDEFVFNSDDEETD